jgi:hypothetical protein
VRLVAPISPQSDFSASVHSPLDDCNDKHSDTAHSDLDAADTSAVHHLSASSTAAHDSLGADPPDAAFAPPSPPGLLLLRDSASVPAISDSGGAPSAAAAAAPAVVELCAESKEPEEGDFHMMDDGGGLELLDGEAGGGSDSLSDASSPITASSEEDSRSSSASPGAASIGSRAVIQPSRPLLQEEQLQEECYPFLRWLCESPISQVEAMVKKMRIKNLATLQPQKSNLRFIFAMLYECGQVDNIRLTALTKLAVCQALFKGLAARQVGSARHHAIALLIKKVRRASLGIDWILVCSPSQPMINCNLLCCVFLFCSGTRVSIEPAINSSPTVRPSLVVRVLHVRGGRVQRCELPSQAGDEKQSARHDVLGPARRVQRRGVSGAHHLERQCCKSAAF